MSLHTLKDDETIASLPPHLRTAFVLKDLEGLSMAEIAEQVDKTVAAVKADLHRARLQGCVWFHASSAGEYEQARPILRALRDRFGPGLPTLATVFSPSGHARASAHPDADVVDYLPFDTPRNTERLVRRLRPRAVVFVKYDCWPNLVWSARRHRVPVMLLGASLHRASQRSSGLARHFFRSVYGSLDAVGTIAEDDARRFREQLDLEASRVQVTGDSRVDQIVRRYEEAGDSPLLAAFGDLPWR